MPLPRASKRAATRSRITSYIGSAVRPRGDLQPSTELSLSPLPLSEPLPPSLASPSIAPAALVATSLVATPPPLLLLLLWPVLLLLLLPTSYLASTAAGRCESGWYDSKRAVASVPCVSSRAVGPPGWLDTNALRSYLRPWMVVTHSYCCCSEAEEEQACTPPALLQLLLRRRRRLKARSRRRAIAHEAGAPRSAANSKHAIAPVCQSSRSPSPSS